MPKLANCRYVAASPGHDAASDTLLPRSDTLPAPTSLLPRSDSQPGPGKTPLFRPASDNGESSDDGFGALGRQLNGSTQRERDAEAQRAKARLQRQQTPFKAAVEAKRARPDTDNEDDEEDEVAAPAKTKKAVHFTKHVKRRRVVDTDDDDGDEYVDDEVSEGDDLDLAPISQKRSGKQYRPVSDKAMKRAAAAAKATPVPPLPTASAMPVPVKPAVPKAAVAKPAVAKPAAAEKKAKPAVKTQRNGAVSSNTGGRPVKKGKKTGKSFPLTVTVKANGVVKVDKPKYDCNSAIKETMLDNAAIKTAWPKFGKDYYDHMTVSAILPRSRGSAKSLRFCYRLHPTSTSSRRSTRTLRPMMIQLQPSILPGMPCRLLSRLLDWQPSVSIRPPLISSLSSTSIGMPTTCSSSRGHTSLVIGGGTKLRKLRRRMSRRAFKGEAGWVVAGFSGL